MQGADLKALEAIIVQQELRYVVEGITLPYAQCYSLQQLHNATDGFDDQLLLGQGGFGKVYRGVLNGEAVAIKKATKKHQHDGKAFTNEIELLTKASHRNLVQLRGFCVENDEQLLVFEFMEGGALNEWIAATPSHPHLLPPSPPHLLPPSHPISFLLSTPISFLLPNPFPPLPHISFRIDPEAQSDVENVASALRYLHSELLNGESVVHGDIKPDNILLTAGQPMEAKVADFGTSKTLPERGKLDFGLRAIRVMFLPSPLSPSPPPPLPSSPPPQGYLDPDFMHSNKLTEYSDVYSFGVVLLQLATGQPPLVPSDHGKVLLRQGVGKVSAREMVVGREEAFDTFLRLVLWCTEGRPNDRPTMVDVESALRNIQQAAAAAGGLQAVQQQQGVARGANGLAPQCGPGLVAGTPFHPVPPRRVQRWETGTVVARLLQLVDLWRKKLRQ
ncbi:unnamed protein product [Closterium sp. NIES-64]|nr:unnamed protein product [Closterium sp. NIES-64]